MRTLSILAFSVLVGCGDDDRAGDGGMRDSSTHDGTLTDTGGSDRAMSIWEAGQKPRSPAIRTS